MRAKSSDREVPEITSYKHLLPRELTDAMKKIIEKLEETANSVLKDVEIFRPSLTPQYSYLRQLLDDPEKDLPSGLRTDFYSAKIGYMTKPAGLQALAARCNINLDVKDTSIHFIEKIVRTFEQSKLPTIPEFNKLVQVEQPVTTKKQRRGTLEREYCDDSGEYLDRNNIGMFFVDSLKRKEYDSSRKSLLQSNLTAGAFDEFGFDEVFPSGKFFGRNDNDTNDESVRHVDVNESQQNGNLSDETTIDFLTKYNIALTNFEKSSLTDSLSSNPTSTWMKKAERKVTRDSVTGKFVTSVPVVNFGRTKSVSLKTHDRRKAMLCENEKLSATEETSERNERYDELTSINGGDTSNPFDLNDDDISILHETSFNSSNDITEIHNSSSACNQSETLFRPYNDYWMYRCNFGRVKQKNFREFEKNLPENFRWLLEECASVIEMSEEDLYEEVCLVESYYADILRPTKCSSTRDRYNSEEYRSKARCNVIKKKW